MSVLNYTRKKNTRSPKGVEMFAFVFIKFFYLYWYIYIIIFLNRKVLLDYCSVVYGSASKSTPIPAQQVLAGAIPLDIRWKQLMTNYWTNLKGHNEQHLTKVVVQECTELLSTVIPEAEPWTRSTTLADMNLLELKKSEWGKVSLLTAFSVHVREHYTPSMYKYILTVQEHQTTVAAFSVPEKKVIGIMHTANYLGV